MSLSFVLLYSRKLRGECVVHLLLAYVACKILMLHTVYQTLSLHFILYYSIPIYDIRVILIYYRHSYYGSFYNK